MVWRPGYPTQLRYDLDDREVLALAQHREDVAAAPGRQGAEVGNATRWGSIAAAAEPQAQAG